MKFIATLAIDFDGVIHDYKHPVKGKRMGKPMQGEAVDDLVNDGFKVIIYTANKVDIVKEWLEHYDIPYHDVTNVKPVADVYIDDRAYRFTTWNDLLNHLDKTYLDD